MAPRTLVVHTILEGAFGDYGADEADITMAAADNANGNYHFLHRGDIVVAHNTTGGALTITFSSVATDTGRTGDITAYSIGAGEIAMFGPFNYRGWRQGSTGWLHYTASAVGVTLGVIREA